MVDEIEVALAIADFRVRQAAPLVGHRAQRLAQERALRDEDRQFAALRPERMPLDADPVARIHPLLDKAVLRFPHFIELEVQLQRIRLVLKISEHRLAVLSQRHDPSGGTQMNRRIRFVGREVVELLADAVKHIGPLPLFDPVGVVPLFLAKAKELFLPLLEDLLLGLHHCVRNLILLLVHTFRLPFPYIQSTTRRFRGCPEPRASQLRRQCSGALPPLPANRGRRRRRTVSP